MMGLVVIQVGSAYAGVRSPFAAKDFIKAIPGARWNRDTRRWLIPADTVDLLATRLRFAGFDVAVQQTGEPTSGPARPDRDTWADRMFAELPNQLVDKAFRALVPVLHPDTGGDLAAMQQLNAARDRRQVRRG